MWVFSSEMVDLREAIVVSSWVMVGVSLGVRIFRVCRCLSSVL